MTTKEDLASPEYVEQLRAMHAEFLWDSGNTCLHLETILKHWDYDPGTVLDYGCGTYSLGVCAPFPVAEYDPGVEGREALPEPADFVICCDVLEHIEPAKIAGVLKHIHSLTKRYAYLVISTRPATKFLKDGRNAHLIVRPPAWWLGILRRFDWEFTTKKHKNNELRVWLKKS